jgi:glycosyltransferase involved in cell wall biosynthesis
MLSVLRQTAVRDGRARLEYVVMDGASSDGTQDVVERVFSAFSSHDHISATLVSEPDHGMYDALAKGLGRSGHSDVVSYINAGDLYAAAAFDAVLDTLVARADVDWLTGMRVSYNAAGQVIDARIPGPYRRRLMRSGFYGSRAGGRFGFLQQESTFWTAELNERLDLERLASFRLAGDFYLWRTFADHAELFVLYSHLGGFRFHGGHLSSDMSAYLAEMRPLVTRARATDWVAAGWDLALQQLPVRVRRHLAGGRLLTWNHALGRFETSGFLPGRT